MSAGLQVSEARLVLGGKSILDGVGFSIAPGRLNGLIGPNGAGKSSLLRTILGLEPMGRASVRFEGEDFLALPRRQRARIAALVEQSHATDQQIDAISVVALGRIPHQGFWGADAAERDAAIVSAALGRTGMLPFATRTFASLSGGEQQRLHIARALAQQPRLLLLDEPTNHLDVAAQLSILALLREMADAGLTVLVTMHDLNLAAGFFDHLIALDKGRIAALGAPEDVLTPVFLRRVYGLEAAIVANPFTGRPMIAYADPQQNPLAAPQKI